MKGFWKRAAMGLLAIAMLLCAACAAPEQEPEQEMQTDIAGADWRTYGQVSDAGTITRAGEQTSVLACVFDKLISDTHYKRHNKKLNKYPKHSVNIGKVRENKYKC